MASICPRSDWSIGFYASMSLRPPRPQPAPYAKWGQVCRPVRKWEVWGFCCTKPSRTALHSGPCSGGRGPAHTCLPTPTRAQVINLTSQMATQVEK